MKNADTELFDDRGDTPLLYIGSGAELPDHKIMPGDKVVLKINDKQVYVESVEIQPSGYFTGIILQV